MTGKIAAAAFIWWLIIVAIYLFNGAMDLTEDRVNGSSRPIASGQISVEFVMRGVLVCALAAMSAAALLGDGFGWFVVAMLALGYVYSGPPFFAKRHPVGTSAVVLLGGLVTYGAGYWTAAGHDRDLVDPELLLLAGAMSLWMSVVGAVAKDFSDVRGDALAGRRNLVLRLGVDRAGRLVSVAAAAHGAAFLVAAAVWAPLLMPAAAVTALGAVVFVAVTARTLRTTGRRRPYRTFMAVQYAAHVAVIATVAYP